MASRWQSSATVCDVNTKRTNERRTQLSFVSLLLLQLHDYCRSSRAYIGFLSFLFLFFFSFLWFVKRSSWVWIRTEPCHFNRIPRTRPVARPRLHREHLAPDRRRRNSRTSVVWCEFRHSIIPQTPPPSTINIYSHTINTHTSKHTWSTYYNYVTLYII